AQRSACGTLSGFAGMIVISFAQGGAAAPLTLRCGCVTPSAFDPRSMAPQAQAGLTTIQLDDRAILESLWILQDKKWTVGGNSGSNESVSRETLGRVEGRGSFNHDVPRLPSALRL